MCACESSQVQLAGKSVAPKQATSLSATLTAFAATRP